MSAFSLAGMSMPSFGTILPMILSGIGTGMEYEGNDQLASNARLSAQRQATALQFQKEQATVNAGQAIAAGQMGAQEQRRQGALINSRAQALAAASGGGALDPTVVRIMANNAGETALRANIALYQGEEQARQLRMQAAARGYDAQMAIPRATPRPMPTAWQPRHPYSRAPDPCLPSMDSANLNQTRPATQVTSATTATWSQGSAITVLAQETFDGTPTRHNRLRQPPDPPAQPGHGRHHRRQRGRHGRTRPADGAQRPGD